MKLRHFILAVGSLLLGMQAYAQTEPGTPTRKPLNNPMYSTHNYKHPQLAAAARQWEAKKGVAVKQPGAVELANYKRQMPVAQPVGGITVPHTPSVSLADRNYKDQRVRETKVIDTKEYYSESEQRKNDKTMAGN